MIYIYIYVFFYIIFFRSVLGQGRAAAAAAPFLNKKRGGMGGAPPMLPAGMGSGRGEVEGGGQ